jgi:hypothetical protein
MATYICLIVHYSSEDLVYKEGLLDFFEVGSDHRVEALAHGFGDLIDLAVVKDQLKFKVIAMLWVQNIGKRNFSSRHALIMHAVLCIMSLVPNALQQLSGQLLGFRKSSISISSRQVEKQMVQEDERWR